jgi:hypothetical protein
VATWLDVQPNEQREIERLHAKGFTTEAARLEIAKRHAVGIDREKRAKEIGRAQMYYRMAEAARAEITRRPAAHPQSWMNRAPPKVEVTTEKTNAEWVMPEMKPFEEGGE